MNGILFKPEMIKAIIEGRKTVTRRTSGLKAINEHPNQWTVLNWKYRKTGDIITAYFFESTMGNQKIVKPRYHVGEVVFVREAHYAYGHWTQFHESGKSHWEFFRDKNTVIHFADTDWQHALTKPSNKEGWYKRSPLFLEAEFARHFVQITGVDACRTRDITPEDCLAEGIVPATINGEIVGYSWDGDILFDTPQAAYFALYDSMHGEGAHLKNWDFRHLFKRVGSNG